jgi:O-antigen biosynthesis protein
MDLSIIIVSYNVRDFLEQCLLSVRKAAEGLVCEIFVVDNNSADGSCDMVTGKFPEVVLMRNMSNRGFSAACNQAIVLAKGKFILLLNPDTVVEEDTFSKCISFMTAHPEAGAAGVKMLDGNGRMLPESKRAFPTPAAALFKMAGLSLLFPRSKYFNRYYLGHLDDTKTAEADIISGAFMFIRRESLEKTGPLDEKFFMYGEDIDLSYRLIMAGYRNYYYPEVKIIHYKGESTRKSDINHTIHFYRAMMIFTDKHFGKQGFGLVSILLQIAIILRGFLSLIKTLIQKIAPSLNIIPSGKRRLVIISNSIEYPRIKSLAVADYRNAVIAGRVGIISEDRDNEVLGNTGQIGEIIRVNSISDVIISTPDLNASEIIELMQILSALRVTIKIAPQGENYFIGSKSAREAKLLS